MIHKPKELPKKKPVGISYWNYFKLLIGNYAYKRWLVEKTHTYSLWKKWFKKEGKKLKRDFYRGYHHPDISRARFRYIIKLFDRYKCRKCGSRENLEVDHIVATALGGRNCLKNLQCLCKTCHRLKTNEEDLGKISEIRKSVKEKYNHLKEFPILRQIIQQKPIFKHLSWIEDYLEGKITKTKQKLFTIDRTIQFKYQFVKECRKYISLERNEVISLKCYIEEILCSSYFKNKHACKRIYKEYPAIKGESFVALLIHLIREATDKELWKYMDYLDERLPLHKSSWSDEQISLHSITTGRNIWEYIYTFKQYSYDTYFNYFKIIAKILKSEIDKRFNKNS